jgi:anti-sigma-K factor RskA
MNQHELIAAYALGELEGAERERFERELAADPALRAEVEATHGTMAQLEGLPGDAWPVAAMPSAVDGAAAQGSEAEVARRPPVPAPERSGARRPPAPAAERSDARPAPAPARARARRRFALSPAFAVAAVVIAAVLGGAIGALIASGGDSSSPPAKTVLVLHPLDAPKDSRADLSMPKADTMLLRAHGLPPSAAGDYYEVWLMSSDSKLVPVASFRVGESGEASVEVPLPAAPDEYAYFDVSRQTVSGGLHHSQDSVLRGATADIEA